MGSTRSGAGTKERVGLCCCLVAKSCPTLRPRGLQPARLLCPWGSPGKNPGVGCHALLQGVFLTQGSNLRLLHLRHRQAGSSPLTRLGSAGESLEAERNPSPATDQAQPGARGKAPARSLYTASQGRQDEKRAVQQNTQQERDRGHLATATDRAGPHPPPTLTRCLTGHAVQPRLNVCAKQSPLKTKTKNHAAEASLDIDWGPGITCGLVSFPTRP